MEVTEETDTAGQNCDNSLFYDKAKSYWSKISPTVNGVLGGFGHISKIDIKSSDLFLQNLFKMENPPGTSRSLDCGAGIGRITKYLLVKYFETVDIIDQNKDFIEKAKIYIDSIHLGQLYCDGLQDFKPENKYDVIWCQWVLGHLTDEHFIQFMQNCKAALNNNGVIIVKENVTSSDSLEVDDEDSSVTRSFKQLTTLFEDSGLKCFKLSSQTHFPKGLYPVKMFALKPSNQIED